MPATAKTKTKKRPAESVLNKSDSKFRVEDEFDLDISSDIQGIMSVLNTIKVKAQKDGQKKNEETISSVASEIRSTIDELKSKIEKDRQNFAKALSKSSKECENSVKNETVKCQEIFEKFSKEKASHMQAIKDTISKFEEDKANMFVKYEQLRKKEKSMISEHEKACTDKIAKLEESLKKKKQGDKTFSFLRKSLGSFLNGSEEDFPADD